MTKRHYVVYCDGASRKDGRGGWGFVVYENGEESYTRCGGTTETTNNRMELQAAIEALKSIPLGAKVTVYSDSQYVVNGILDHLDIWLMTGWMTSSMKPVKNADLWEELGFLDVDRKVDWLWVRGHSGVPGNELADQLATQGVPPASS